MASKFEMKVAENIAKCWYGGYLGYPGLLYPHAQTSLYHWVHDWKEKHFNDAGPLVWNCHRGFGKSTELVVLCIERCLKYPSQEVRYAAPSFKQCKEIVMPAVWKVLAQCPTDLRPQFSGGFEFIFNNPAWGTNEVSRLVIIGCREGADAERGKRSNMIVIDEVRDIDRPKYVIEDVLGPHFARRANPLMILSSTPPLDIDHYFMKCCEEALLDDRYYKVRNLDNKDWADVDEKLMVRLLRGADTPAYKREMLCELVPDDSYLATPEFRHVKDEIVVDCYQRPSHFYCFIGMDLGFKDYTAILYSYIDFVNHRLVIEDETFVNQKTTQEIANFLREKEQELYSKTPLYKWIRRWSDNDPQELADLKKIYDIHIAAAEKTDKWASLASLRTGIANKQIVILRKCRHLIKQLECGRKNNKETDFERENFREVSPDEPLKGHCDSIAALMYLWRMIKPYWDQYPFPSEGYHTANMFYPQTIKNRGNITITRNPLKLIPRSIK